jgi:hypothetical protein
MRWTHGISVAARTRRCVQGSGRAQWRTHRACDTDTVCALAGRQLGDVDAAIADFTHVLSLDPNHVKVRTDDALPASPIHVLPHSVACHEGGAPLTALGRRRRRRRRTREGLVRTSKGISSRP